MPERVGGNGGDKVILQAQDVQLQILLRKFVRNDGNPVPGQV